RLTVVWELDAAPRDALMPPMILQPLLENAIYHGIEPGAGEGRVVVRIERRGARVFARIDNPYIEEHAHRAGNRMSLENIRERLQLFFDIEARIDMRVAGERYVVEITMPYRPARA
ncbi:MAG: sensor histidine kinase, partial [Betaproteobacteria bacterium]|nr:sensor histidine kinase [Betaproteobacteria bacterium]